MPKFRSKRWPWPLTLPIIWFCPMHSCLCRERHLSGRRKQFSPLTVSIRSVQSFWSSLNLSFLHSFHSRLPSSRSNQTPENWLQTFRRFRTHDGQQERQEFSSCQAGKIKKRQDKIKSNQYVCRFKPKLNIWCKNRALNLLCLPEWMS